LGECVNQRALAARLDLSLGLVNGLLQELRKERLIRVGAANESPYAVTVKGRAAMVKLSMACASEADVLLEGFRGELEKLAARLRSQKRRSALLCGNGALSELAAAALQNNGVRIAGVVAQVPGSARVAGMRVRRVEDAAKIKQDVCVAMTAEDAKALRKSAGKGARIVQAIPGK
jgi:DNA-binding transcriptional regulator LsrR (DeoR family)